MARKMRIDAAGMFHHVYNRGGGRRRIFHDDIDRRSFLALLALGSSRWDVVVDSYCLMDNHFHLVLHSENGTLAEAMHAAMFRYVKRFNWRHGLDGPLFRDRYGSRPVEDDSDLMEVSRYVHRNPSDIVGADIVRYRWSSLGAYAGIRPTPSWLRTETVLGYFAGDPQAYLAFVAPGATIIRGAADTDSAPTVADIVSLVSEELGVPRQEVHAGTRGRLNPGRLTACYVAVELVGIDPRTIATELGFMSERSIAGAVMRYRQMCLRDAELANRCEAIAGLAMTGRQST